MPAPTNNTRAAISVTEMMSMLGLRSSRFYELIRIGKLPGPCYHVETRRPLYPVELVEVCQRIKATNVALDGNYLVFYQRRTNIQPPSRRHRQNAMPSSIPPVQQHDHLIEGLRSLGLQVTAGEVEEAIRVCFPTGTTRTDEGEVLRSIFRHLRRSRG